MDGVDYQLDNLKKAISKSKNINLDKFIYSIGIRHIGQENAKIIASIFVSAHEFSKLFDENNRSSILSNLIELDGIGETQINSINNFFSNNKNSKIISDLMQCLVINNYNLVKKNGKFSNKRLMFTGGFTKMSRSEAKSVAENNGVKVLGSLSKKA